MFREKEANVIVSNNISKEKIVESVPQTGFFGQPKGLFTLFFTEFWERFSYYGMRAILLYYMYTEVTSGGLGIDEEISRSIMAIYGALVYMSGVVGGWIADRLLGMQKTIFYGGILIMAGHIVLALPAGQTALFISMFLIVMGTGLLKPNVSNVVGAMYSPTDLRRDSGFSIFYMGINLGAFIAPFIVGTLGQEYNYHLGFGAAAVGMFLGLVIFVITRKKYLGLAGVDIPNPLKDDEKKKILRWIGLGAVVISVLLIITSITGLLNVDRFILIISILGVVIPTIYFIVMYKSPKTNAEEKSRLIAYIPLFVAAIMFWAIAEQGSIVLAEYADKRTQLSLFGFELKSSWFQSLNPLFIIILSPVFAAIWMKMGKRQPSTSQKFSYGLFFAGISFLIMTLPSFIQGGELAHPIWLVLSFLFVVIGELCLSPVGLSATTKLAPAAFSAQTMSLWFLSNAAAQGINAQIVKLFSFDHEVLYFGAIGASAILLGIILYLLAPTIQKYMKGIR